MQSTTGLGRLEMLAMQEPRGVREDIYGVSDNRDRDRSPALYGSAKSLNPPGNIAEIRPKCGAGGSDRQAACRRRPRGRARSFRPRLSRNALALPLPARLNTPSLGRSGASVVRRFLSRRVGGSNLYAGTIFQCRLKQRIPISWTLRRPPPTRPARFGSRT